MRVRLLILLALPALCLAGCAPTRKRKAASTPPPAAAPSLIEVGTITLVNAPGHFVLIDHGMLSAPSGGGILKSFTDGAESAELVVTEVKRGSFTIADIRSGEPHKGDRVFFVPPELRKAAGAGATPAPVKLPGEGPRLLQSPPAPALDQ